MYNQFNNTDFFFLIDNICFKLQLYNISGSFGNNVELKKKV